MHFRSFIVLVIGVAALGVAPADAAPKAADQGKVQKSTRSPGGKRVAEVRTRPVGGEALWIDGAPVWPVGQAGVAALVGPLSWSKKGDAVATIAQKGGHTFLIVAVLGPSGGARVDVQALEWLIPASVGPARAIMWLGPTRVAVGPREMEPKLVASWSVAE
jgi:hypothetical protein